MLSACRRIKHALLRSSRVHVTACFHRLRHFRPLHAAICPRDTPDKHTSSLPCRQPAASSTWKKLVKTLNEGITADTATLSSYLHLVTQQSAGSQDSISPAADAPGAELQQHWESLITNTPRTSTQQCIHAAYASAKLHSRCEAVTRSTSSTTFPHASAHEEEAAALRIHRSTVASAVAPLVHGLSDQLHAVDSAALVKLAWACAVLHIHPDARWWHEFSNAIAPGLSALSPQQLCTLLGALGGMSPLLQSPGTSSSLLSPSPVHTSAAPPDPALLDSLADLPPDILLSSPSPVGPRPASALALQTLLSLQPHLVSLDHCTLLSIIRGLAQLKLPPPSSEWWQAYTSGLGLCVHQLTEHQVLTLAISLEKSRCTIPCELSNILGWAVVSNLEGMTASQLARVLRALSKIGAHLKWKVLSTLLDHFKTLLASASGQDLLFVIESLPVLCVEYPEQHMSTSRKYLIMALAKHSMMFLATYKPHQLVKLVEGFTSLGFYPGALWVKQHREACIQRRAEFNARLMVQVNMAYKRLITLS